MENANDSTVMTSPEYRRFIEDLKARVISARICAARAVNRDLILLYWDIGHGIVEKQKTLGWGDAVVEMVAADLRRAFPGTTGFSPHNVWRMASSTRPMTTHEFLAQVVREIDHGMERRQLKAAKNSAQLVQRNDCGRPWGQNLLILNKLSDPSPVFTTSAPPPGSAGRATCC